MEPPLGTSMRRLVVFADGTWSRPDHVDRGKRKPTNVTKLARAVNPIASDGTSQITYYDAGVGTHWSFADKWLGGGFGVGVMTNVARAYQWISYNYTSDDELFLFGFSRGAFTVRSLAGMIDLIGVLPKDHAYYLPEAVRLYTRRADCALLSHFRHRHNTTSARIRFVGVWDTVGALGIPLPFFDKLTRRKYEFHNITLGQCVDHARQALAIDELRRPYQPCLWSTPTRKGQTIEQRWFPGVHANIGGGYAKDGLANGPLHWIASEAARQGLALDNAFLAHYRPFVGHELRRTYCGLWRLFGSSTRPIGTITPATETVDVTALERYRDDPSYRPPNLERYLSRNVPRVASSAPKP